MDPQQTTSVGESRASAHTFYTSELALYLTAAIMATWQAWSYRPHSVDLGLGLSVSLGSDFSFFIMSAFNNNKEKVSF